MGRQRGPFLQDLSIQELQALLGAKNACLPRAVVLVAGPAPRADAAVRSLDTGAGGNGRQANHNTPMNLCTCGMIRTRVRYRLATSCQWSISRSLGARVTGPNGV